MGDNGHREYENTKTGNLTIFIADSQPLYRQAIRHVLDEDIEVVGESELNDDIWKAIETLSPNMVLVDIGLPLLSGFGIARQIAVRCPGVRVVMLTPSPNDDQLFQALKSGAVALVTKNITSEELNSLLKRIGAGAYPINEALLSQPHAANKVLQLFKDLSLMGKDIESLMTPLSPRETEILKRIASGTANKRIATMLSISEQTIKNHITSILRKLNANDRTHAVVLAVHRGWINIEEAIKLPDREGVVTLR